MIDWLKNPVADVIDFVHWTFIADMMIEWLIFWAAIYLLTKWVAGRL